MPTRYTCYIDKYNTFLLDRKQRASAVTAQSNKIKCMY